VTIAINQVSNGVALRIDGNIFQIVTFDHVKPGKGTAFVRLKLKNVKTGQVLEKTYKTADKLDDVPLEDRKLQYLYSSADDYHFMDNESFEEVAISTEIMGDAIKFLQDDMEVVAKSFNEEVLKVEVPMFIEAEIAQTEPGLKGDSSKAGTKPATIDTGANVLVPLFVTIGDFIKVDTRSGEYVERVKK
jgi:elongation factor P